MISFSDHSIDYHKSKKENLFRVDFKFVKSMLLPLFLMYGGMHCSISQPIPKIYTAFKIDQELLIDGNENEVAWQFIPWSDNFIDIEGVKAPKYNTKVKMAWNDTYFYLLAKLEEQHVWGDLKKKDTVIFYNNDFEVFIDPDGDTHNYYELEINALNTAWDLFLTKPYRNGGKVLDSWDIQGLKSAIKIEGTLNDPSDEDKGWSIEIAIPWVAITEASNSNKAPANHFWRINFSRVNWDFDISDKNYSRKKDAAGKYMPEYNWVWSPQEVINMHEPERWGYVYFSDELSSSGFQFELPRDEKLKWKLYEQYRKLHEDLNYEIPDKFVNDDTSISLNLEKHLLGWNLWVLSPYTNKKLIISKDGKFNSIK
ncbi:carbohydrate-binding family 9-like protein [Croceitalea marina]|uniref:Carbohydrate-binding family 9-like protein n=1 Tax=Croceitalea marina TaxID=1775166 RepID=A0ABW5N323_9FLAO